MDRIEALNKALKERFGNNYNTVDGLTMTIYIRKEGVFLSRTFPSIEDFERFVSVKGE